MEKDECGQPLLSDCMKHMLAINDTMDVLSGKWKIRIMAALTYSSQRFGDLQFILEGIGPKMLSKELQELEINGLIKKVTVSTKPLTVNYEVTEHGQTLKRVIFEMAEWGNDHRKKVMEKK
jgi:DNA-binding HxlR family transcriptional regulator